MIEINSSVHVQHATLHGELAAIGRGLIAAGARHDVHVRGGGTHSFHRWEDRRLSPSERFQAVGHLYGYLAKQFTGKPMGLPRRPRQPEAIRLRGASWRERRLRGDGGHARRTSPQARCRGNCGR